MGKQLIIKGADFSANAIDAEEYVDLLLTQERKNGIINASTNKYNTNSGTYIGALCNVLAYVGKRLVVKAGGNTYVAFLSSATLTHNVTPSYATGWSAVEAVVGGETKEYTIPSNAVAFYFYVGTPTDDRVPQYVRVYM